MNVHEARLEVLNRVRDVLLDLADGKPGDLELEDSMGEAAELILEALGLEVAVVDDSYTLTCVLNLPYQGDDDL